MLTPWKCTSLQRHASTGSRPPAIATENNGRHPQRFRAGPMSFLHFAIASQTEWSLNARALELHRAATTCAHGFATTRECEKDRRCPSPMLPRRSNEHLSHFNRVPNCVVFERSGHTSPPRCKDLRPRVGDHPPYRQRSMMAITNSSARVQ